MSIRYNCALQPDKNVSAFETTAPHTNNPPNISQHLNKFLPRTRSLKRFEAEDQKPIKLTWFSFRILNIQLTHGTYFRGTVSSHTVNSVIAALSSFSGLSDPIDFFNSASGYLIVRLAISLFLDRFRQSRRVWPRLKMFLIRHFPSTLCTCLLSRHMRQTSHQVTHLLNVPFSRKPGIWSGPCCVCGSASTLYKADLFHGQYYRKLSFSILFIWPSQPQCQFSLCFWNWEILKALYKVWVVLTLTSIVLATSFSTANFFKRNHSRIKQFLKTKTFYG